MSIRKIKLCLQARLRKKDKRIVAETPSKQIVLNNEELKILSLLDRRRNICDLAKLLKKKINYILRKALDLEDLGIVNLELFCENPVLKRLYEKPGVIAEIRKQRPDMSNIVAYEKEWGMYPTTFDFLSEDSEFYKLKNFEKEIYFNQIRSFLNRLPKRAVILDAGAGIGRFACELVKMGHRVHLFDSSEIALKKALRHLLQEEKAVDFDLHWGDIANLSMFSSATFNSIFAIELICYCSNPKKVVKELVRVTKKGGLIFISVEGKYGGILFDPKVSLDKVAKILQVNLLHIKDYLYVRYYTEKSLSKLLEGCGIEVLGIFGCHYVPEGILHRLIKEDKLDNARHRKDLLKVEKLCQEDPVLNNLARAWVAVGRKK